MHFPLAFGGEKGLGCSVFAPPVSCHPEYFVCSSFPNPQPFRSRAKLVECQRPRETKFKKTEGGWSPGRPEAAPLEGGGRKRPPRSVPTSRFGPEQWLFARKTKFGGGRARPGSQARIGGRLPQARSGEVPPSSPIRTTVGPGDPRLPHAPQPNPRPSARTPSPGSEAEPAANNARPAPAPPPRAHWPEPNGAAPRRREQAWVHDARGAGLGGGARARGGPCAGGGGALCAAVRGAASAAVGRAGARGIMEELSSVGEQVFAAECILSKRLRKVRAAPARPLPPPPAPRPPAPAHALPLSPQGKLEYLVKWRGWSSK